MNFSMIKHRVGTVVNFCTNESKFIAPCLQEVLKFSRQVIVVVASHFFDGTEENRPLLSQIYRAFPKVLFVEYPFIPSLIPKSIFKAVRPAAFWHCLSRLIGFSFLAKEIDWTLFIDADEVADGARVGEWLDCSGYECHAVLRLANYWYFREPIFRANVVEDSVVMVSNRTAEADLLLDSTERSALYDRLPGPKRRMVMGPDGEPLFHHFSWVRSEEEMLKKVRSWGHKGERNWEELVKEEFKKPFQGTDFVHGYRFQTVEDQFGIEKGFSFASNQENTRSNVKSLSEKQVIQFAKMKKVPFWSSFLPWK
jgi:hypothetical protein